MTTTASDPLVLRLEESNWGELLLDAPSVHRAEAVEGAVELLQ